MIKAIILLVCALSFGGIALCQQPLNTDSLLGELRRVMPVVDSLRKNADDQFSIHESLEKSIDSLSHSGDSSTNGLAGWRRAYARQTVTLDSALFRLDSALGVKQRLQAMIRQSLIQKHRKKLGQN